MTQKSNENQCPPTFQTSIDHQKNTILNNFTSTGEYAVNSDELRSDFRTAFTIYSSANDAACVPCTFCTGK